MELEKLSTPKEPIPPQASHSTWTWLFPLAGLVALAATLWRPFFLTWLLSGTLLPFLVFTGVHHAEAISHRIGEPFGMLVRWPSPSRGVAHRLPDARPRRRECRAGARRTSAVMFASDGVVGACLPAGGVFHREQEFKVSGASAALAVLSAPEHRRRVHPLWKDHPGSTRLRSPGRAA